MTSNRVFYTATMAKVHAGQGNLEKAVEIYRHLLEQEPGRQDLVDGLSVVEQRMQQNRKGGRADLIRLIGTWIDLLMEYNNLKKLKNLHRHTGSGSADAS
jgi:hypothetical protein